MLTEASLFAASAGPGVARPPYYSWILLAGVLAVFPASAAIMAMTRNVAAALSPAAVISFVRDLGGDYSKLLGVSALLGVLLGLTSELARASWFLGSSLRMRR